MDEVDVRLQNRGDRVLERADTGRTARDVCKHGEFGGKQVVRLGNRDTDLEHVAGRRDWLGCDVVLRKPLVHGVKRLVCRLDKFGNLSANGTRDQTCSWQRKLRKSIPRLRSNIGRRLEVC